MTNHMKTEFEAKKVNISFARMAVMGFIAYLNPTLEEAEDIKTAVSEAVTNAIIHGYEKKEGIVTLECFLMDNTLMVSVSDKGVGIEDIKKAREALFTTKPDEERSGLGFTVMESFMDSLHIKSKPGEGTEVTMSKRIEKYD